LRDNMHRLLYRLRLVLGLLYFLHLRGRNGRLKQSREQHLRANGQVREVQTIGGRIPVGTYEVRCHEASS